MGDKTAVDGDLRGKGGGRDDESGSLSTLFKADGFSPCRIRRESQRLFFHMTLARAGEVLVFHLNSVAKQ